MYDRRKVLRFPFPKFHRTDFSHPSQDRNINFKLPLCRGSRVGCKTNPTQATRLPQQILLQVSGSGTYDLRVVRLQRLVTMPAIARLRLSSRSSAKPVLEQER